MTILIVGVDHEMQKAKSVHDSDERIERKGQLEALLRRAITERKVEFISEESDPNCLTVAQQMADACKPRIRWKNVMMPEEERKRAGIHEALKRRPVRLEGMESGRPFQVEHRIPEDEVYEAYIIQQTKQGADDAQSILIICGDLHVDGLGGKLEKDGHRVDRNHSLVEKRWE